MTPFLVQLCQRVLKKYKPKVIGIVGDQERIIVKDAVTFLLDSKYKGQVRKTPVNSEDSPSSVIAGVLGLQLGFSKQQAIRKAFSLLMFHHNYPEYLVVEYPVNSKGKMDSFLEIVKPEVGILSGITNRNREFFKSIEEEISEKGKIIEAVSKEGCMILNGDDKNVMSLAKTAKVPLKTYGFLEDHFTVKAEDFKLAQTDDQDHETDERVLGVLCKLGNQGSKIPVFLPKVIGADHIRGVMASFLVGAHCRMNLVEMAEIFKNYEGSKGRMTLLKGIKNSLLIDDTYDANPYSMDVALETLAAVQLEAPREKFAILGDMNHLGRYTEEEHQEIGKKVLDASPDYLCVVGEKARDILRAARKEGFPEDRIFYFRGPEQAGIFIQNRLERGDLILVTGAWEMRMEKIIKELMAEPLEYRMKLVRSEDL